MSQITGYGGTSGMYRTSAITLSDNQEATPSLDAGASLSVTDGGLLATPVAVSANPTVVKATAGRLARVLVTTAGTSQAMTIYDNASAASGTVIGIVPSSAVAGNIYVFNMPAANGITCSGSSNNPAVTISWV